MASAADIDRYLAGKRSPLAGLGGVFVRESAAVGVDPRLLVAISGAETSFGTTGNAAAIHNPFGLGPGRRYPTNSAAIRAAAQSLGGRLYKGAGLYTIPQIQGRWAPVGASNDPANLNSNWRANVTAYYTEQGGSGAPAASVFGKNAGFAGLQAARGPAVVNPVRGATYTIIGRPGQGTHNGAPPFDNWQSRDAYDLKVPVGTPVYAPVGGTISKISSGAGTGRTAGTAVTIRGNGANANLSFYLAHLSRLAPGVREGPVATGQLIGYSGSANGAAHLHFAAYSEGGHLDIWKAILSPTQTDRGGGKFKGTESGFLAPVGGKDASLPNLPNPFGWLGDLEVWIVDHAAKALAYLVAGAFAVYLLAQGSSHAFGTPAPGDVARLAARV